MTVPEYIQSIVKIQIPVTEINAPNMSLLNNDNEVAVIRTDKNNILAYNMYKDEISIFALTKIERDLIALNDKLKFISLHLKNADKYRDDNINIGDIIILGVTTEGIDEPTQRHIMCLKIEVYYENL